ncbi:hypothetical protein [Pseudomonas koreensis]|uniref:hypothetical protein n=1 Tax=Pseudomonas koreensis TaxID=198620 RepID=UPI002FCC14CF
MIKKSGGGAATNSGIDFQQRTAAFFTLSMALDLDCSRILDRNDITKIVKVSFESDDAIDDIVLTHDKSKSYLQVKRKLSLSDNKQSEFYKTIEQFVRQNKISQNKEDCFCIATSRDSSRKILSELKKLTKSARLAQDNLSSSPLSQSEHAVLGTVYKCINKAYDDNNLKHPTDLDRENLLAKMHIIELDIESGGAYENAFLISIATQLSTNPDLVWNMLISKTLDWSKKRSSLDVTGIRSQLSQFISSNLNEPEHLKETEDFFKLVFDPNNYRICSGREVLLIKMLEEDEHVTLISFARFDDNGKPYLKFHDSCIELGDGSTRKLYGRFSTFKGAERYLLDNKDKNSKLLIVETEDQHDFDSDQIAIIYSEKVRNKMLENTELSKCMHCGLGLSQDALNVEIDEEYIPFDVGLIHKECQRASDRVLGRSTNPGMEKHPELKDFDYKKWFSLLTKSQSLWASYSNLNEPIKNILWNSSAAFTQKGNFCIKVSLADGSIKFILQRGKVHRFTSENADAACANFKRMLTEAKRKRNPLCYSENGEMFATRDQILEHSRSSFDAIDCTGFEKTTYTRGISTFYDTCENFYAPLIALTTPKEKHILFNETLFLITNPMKLGAFLSNWNSIGFDPSPYRIKIIETDFQFDELLMSLITQNQKILVDPLFNSDTSLARGSEVMEMETFKLSNAKFVLHLFSNKDEPTQTIILKNQHRDLSFLLSSECKVTQCECFGCQTIGLMTKLHGKDNITTHQTGPISSAVVIDEAAIAVDEDVLFSLVINWAPWELKIQDAV